MEEDECHVCFSRSLELVNGAVVCTACGTQALTFTQEHENDVMLTNRLKAAALPATIGLVGRTEEAVSDEALARAYCVCLQETLAALCAWLSRELALDDAFEGVCKALWGAFLTASGMLEPGFLTADREAKRQKAEEQGEEADAVELGATMALRFKLHKTLHPTEVLVVLLLASLLLRTAVMPQDLAGMALSGRMPFWATLVQRARAADSDGRMRLVATCQHATLKGPLELSMGAALAAQRMRLRLPPLNAEALLQRFCHELSLPLEACAGAQALLRVCHATGLRLLLTTKHAHSPWTQLMAVLVVSVAADWQEGGGAARMPPGFDWGIWARGVVGRASARQPPGLQADGQTFGDLAGARAALSAGMGAALEQEEGVQDVQAGLADAWQALRQPAARPAVSQDADGGARQTPTQRRQSAFAFLVVAGAAVVWALPGDLYGLARQLQKEVAAIDKAAERA